MSLAAANGCPHPLCSTRQAAAQHQQSVCCSRRRVHHWSQSTSLAAHPSTRNQCTCKIWAGQAQRRMCWQVPGPAAQALLCLCQCLAAAAGDVAFHKAPCHNHPTMLNVAKSPHGMAPRPLYSCLSCCNPSYNAQRAHHRADWKNARPVGDLPRQHGAHASVLSVVAEGRVVIDHASAGKMGGVSVAASVLPQVQQQMILRCT